MADTPQHELRPVADFLAERYERKGAPARQPEACDYESAMYNLQETYDEGIRAFARWLTANWGQTREEWQQCIADPAPPQEYFDGQRALLDSMLDAAQLYIQEHLR